MKNALSLHQTAQARRLYHHFIHGGILNERDMARMGSYIEVRDTRISELEGEVQFLCSLCNPHGGESTTYETVRFCGFSIKEITRILAAALSTQENTTMTNRQRLKENKDFAKKGLDWAREFSTCEASWTLALQDYEDACRLYYINLKTEEEE